MNKRLIPPDTRVPIAWTTADGFSLVHRAKSVPGAPAAACGAPVPEGGPGTFLVGASACALAETAYCSECWSWNDRVRARLCGRRREVPK